MQNAVSKFFNSWDDAGSLYRLMIAMLAAIALWSAIPTPANAGGHEWWRSCGGHTYEGCDGVRRGPYADRRHQPGRVHRGHQGHRGDGIVRGRERGGGAYGNSGHSRSQGHMRRRVHEELDVYRRTTVTRKVLLGQNKWHVRCVNGNCECISGICPSKFRD